jgi:hypothetical protein
MCKYVSIYTHMYGCAYTGAVAMVLSVAYLAAVAVLESRGPLQPPPCEATGLGFRVWGLGLGFSFLGCRV